MSDEREPEAIIWRELAKSAGLDVVTIEDGLIQARCP